MRDIGLSLSKIFDTIKVNKWAHSTLFKEFQYGISYHRARPRNRRL